MNIEELRQRRASRFDFLRSLRVMVLAGGSSREREVSLVSGHAVARGLMAAGYRIELVEINADERHFFRTLPEDEPLEGADVLEFVRQADAVFPVLHGTRGEDGVWQGYFELAGLPYVSADVAASALAMDKVVSKRMFAALGIATPAYCTATVEHCQREDFPAPVAELVAKPVREGSSVGIEMLDNDAAGWQRVAELAAEYGDMLVEERIRGAEITVGIIGHANDPVALPLVEIRPRQQDFYDYKAKYTKGETEYLIPAPIADATAEEITRNALTIYHDFGLAPYARIDCLLDADGRPWFLEANTLPGFTDVSLLPQAAASVGMGFSELLETLLLLAIERREGGT